MIRQMPGRGIKRVGVTVKPGHAEALKTARELSTWLTERGIELVGEPRVQKKSSEDPDFNTVDDADFAARFMARRSSAIACTAARTAGCRDMKSLKSRSDRTRKLQ